MDTDGRMRFPKKISKDEKKTVFKQISWMLIESKNRKQNTIWMS